MFKKIVCFVLSLMFALPILGCSNNIPAVETTSPFEPIEGVIAETDAPAESTIPTEISPLEIEPKETGAGETEPPVPAFSNDDEVTEILYLTIEALNIREKPSANSKIVGCYRRGDEITVIGRGGNGGWIEVYFYDKNGEGCVGYCANGYYFDIGRAPIEVKKEEPEEIKQSEISPTDLTIPNETVSETTIPIETEPEETKPSHPALENQGTYGRLIIPDVDISCQLNFVDANSSEASYLAQHYTDMENSAAFFRYGNMYVISDHKEQGFANLENVNENDVAYIGSNDNLIELYCYKTRYGKNGLDGLTTDCNESGTGFDGYLIYTFSDTKDGCNIFMTYWREKTW